MSLTVLTLRTHDGEHQLACLPGASLDVGSGPECEIVLEGVDVLPRHCVLLRTGEQRFQITAAVVGARFAVNGVTAGELEVMVPFAFDIGGDVIEFDLVDDDAEVPPPDTTTTEHDAGTAITTARDNRRNYLLRPTGMKPRAGGRVGEVMLEPSPAAAATVASPSPARLQHVAATAPSQPEEEVSTPLMLTIVLVCGVMIATILYWQRHLEQVALPPPLEVQTVVPRDTEITSEAMLRACVDLRLMGTPMLAAHLLMPLAETGDVGAMHVLASALHEAGQYGEEVVFLLEQAAEGGSREAWRELVREVDHEENPARYVASSFVLLRRAATLGETSAWMPLGERHEYGNGIPQDMQRALAAYEKAHAAGDARAAAKLSARQAALDRAAAFIRSWNEVSVAALLDHVVAEQGRFFMLDHPPMDALLRLEDELRARWPLRRISVAAGAKVKVEDFDHIQITQPFQFEVQRGERIARGLGVLVCAVQRDTADQWRITAAGETIEVNELLPARERFVVAGSLRELKPAFTPAEQIEESRLEIVRALRGIEDTQDFKAPLTALMNAVFEFPQEAFWRPFADTLCDRMARQLFAEGQWLDAGWAEPVHQLAERGSVSAMLLEGHLLAAGYGCARDEKRSTALYQKAFEQGQRRDARFYYAEALFQGRGVPQDSDKAGALVLALMSRSKHPLEAYLAAHLLWRKAEIDPALWQDVYNTLSRVADQHPPAKNLAGMVLLNHGQTTKERKTGFAAIKAAAEAGVVEAMKTLAHCYQEGIGCEKDFLIATTWKQKAAITTPPRRKHYTEFGE